MSVVKYSCKDNKKKLLRLSCGDVLELCSDEYQNPLVLTGLVGTSDQPITIRPKKNEQATFTSGWKDDEARIWANKAADQRQRSGYYPSVGHLGDQAMLVLRNCQFVIIRGIDFKNCWPTAIYLDNCQNIVLHDLKFTGGTIAIGANGIDTRDLIVQHCCWRQDTSKKNKMWNSIPWPRIHGASNNSDAPDVDIYGDYRYWDGDFFRAWNVTGNVIIRDNHVSDAFNGIHFFNSHDRLAPGVVASQLQFNGGRQASANVLIERNSFTRIRDNIFEPEYHAWNWVIRYNHMRDCYRPFSFEFERAGWIYVYGNTASFKSSPSTKMSTEDKEKYPSSEWRKSPSLFKPNGPQLNEGPIYVLNNSWYMATGKGLLPKFVLGRLVHANNLAEFEHPEKGMLFGKDGMKAISMPWSEEYEKTAEASRFTRRWREYKIEIFSDTANDSNFPEVYRQVGYPIGSETINKYPGFTDPAACPPDFTPKSGEALGKSNNVTIELPDATSEVFEGGHDRGACHGDDSLSGLDDMMRFLPTDDWLPDLPTARKHDS
ncbi:MAG: hypothetical protein AAF362_02770 [Pseudomonadota bacterium]